MSGNCGATNPSDKVSRPTVSVTLLAQELRVSITNLDASAVMPSLPQSAIGNLADLEEGQIALSGFVVQHDNGLYVRRARLESATAFADFVNRVVASGLYFRGLDYPQFLKVKA